MSHKKVLILGYSITGIASAKYLAKLGLDCFLSEYGSLESFDTAALKELTELGVKTEFGGHSNEFILGSEFAIVSPGIAPNAPIIRTLNELKIEYFSDIELAYKKEGEKILAITGTNGKTTTTMLASHVLSKKYKAPYCGNIGVSPCDYIGKGINYYVCEVSSAQLQYSPTFAPNIALYTNFTPDHISWHGSEEEYFRAKAQMFKKMSKEQHAILNYDDKRLVELSKELKCHLHFFSLKSQKDAYFKDGAIFYKDEKIINIDELSILGPHNIQNVMGVVILAKILQISTKSLINSLRSFRAPAHRCEYVCSTNNISFYNDSKATNPEATIVALRSFKGKRVCLIAGGRDKNTSLDEFCNEVKENIDSVVLLGEAKERFSQALKESGFENIIYGTTLENTIEKAVEQSPEVVLFSPACASFDMFKNYEQRGEAFKEYVLSKR